MELWKSVADWPGFEISSLGRVKTLDRVIKVHHRSGLESEKIWRGKILKQAPDIRNDKLVRMRVYLTGGGRQQLEPVHLLVLRAFVGPRPDGCYGCHNDGNPANNALSNLRWDTPASNSADAKRHGTAVPPPRMVGDRHPSTKLGFDDVCEIRKLFESGAYTRKQLSIMFGVHLPPATDPADGDKPVPRIAPAGTIAHCFIPDEPGLGQQGE
jgi:hypothetical protein